MPTRAYTLRSEYEGQLVGGSVISDASGGIMHIADALKEGNGEIITDDPFLQGTLDNVYGAQGPLFKVALVEGDKRKSIPSATAPGPGDFGPPPPVEAATEIGQSAASVPQAQHGELSEYSQLTMEEAKELLDERHVPYAKGAKKEELIAALEQSNTEGAGSGS